MPVILLLVFIVMALYFTGILDEIAFCVQMDAKAALHTAPTPHAKLKPPSD